MDPVGAPLADLAFLAQDEPGLRDVMGRRNAVLAVPEVARAVVLAALAGAGSRTPLVIATPTGTAARDLADDLAAFVPAGDVEHFPAWETLPFERVSPAVQTMGERTRVLWRLRSDGHRPRIVVAGVRALLQKLSPGWEGLDPLEVQCGSTVDLEALCEGLVRYGYRRENVVEHRGEFARRGSIVDIFPSTDDEPVRIDTWGDEVDRLTRFDVTGQRSSEDIDLVRVFPARELVVDDRVRSRAAALVSAEPWGREQWERLAEGQVFDGMESWLPWLTDRDVLLTDAIGPDAFVVLADPRRMLDRARELIADEDDLARALASSWARDASVEFPRLHVSPDRLLSADLPVPALNLVSAPDSPGAQLVQAAGWGPIVHDPGPVASRVSQMLSERWRVVAVASTDEAANRLVDLFAGFGVSFARPRGNDDLLQPGAWVTVGRLSAGFSMPSSRLAVITESDLSGRRSTRRRSQSRSRAAITVFEDLKPGGYVVHAHHGVGRYEGMVKRALGDVERDYLLIEYKGGDRLYVPTDQLASLRQYVGGEAPTLHRMGGSDFARTKSRVRSAVREVAQELVVLYQKRVNARGHAFPPDTPWQGEMEQAFPFVETPDQDKAIAAVKEDMESGVPMERLICGDVGFGKTEVAVRAAFKAIQAGKQVAVLVPTTLLAAQHGNTFSERFAGYPIRVEVLSRFLSAAASRKVIEGLKSGEVDCVIGTHRLLQESVSFKDLGLLVIDEEQRFGVQHKEAIKRLRHDVDVITMSATPIPRTLELSLVGIRDLSLLNTPPADRQPILTYVGEFSEPVALEAIRRELLREGQVFWVHNRVQSIEDRARELRDLVPEARIAVAHGQMDETELEQVVLDFWERRFDVLVCTTIIESGIDMPAVNTLVVERADLLGLGQLHQLRGRVGRGGQRAYAYLFHPRDRTMTEEAHERLRTIGEATELGSGFKIAMRDLEIRGAGNLLGEAQSGHIAAVGYDLYCQMVTEAVAEMKGERTEEPREIRIDVPVDAHLPADYVPGEELRLEAYRRLAEVTTADGVRDVEREWRDRFGPLPPAAASLLTVALLRTECLRCGFEEIVETGGGIRISPVELRASQAMALRRVSPRAEWREKQKHMIVPVHRDDPAGEVLRIIGELWENGDEN
ncbi:MAG: transcription-repair coupling factor [Acidimicrobiales bacterium]